MRDLWRKTEERLRRIPAFNEGFTFAAAMGRRSLPTNAASISFYFFVSVVPFFILLCSQVPYTGVGRDGLIEVVTRFTPDSVDALVTAVINEAYSSHVALFSVSLAALMWSSSKVVTAVIRSLDQVYGETDSRSFFAVAGNALLYTALLLIGSSGLLFLVTKGKSAEELLFSFFPFEDATRAVAPLGRRVAGVLLFVLFFALVYKFFPAGKRAYAAQLPGSLIAEGGILLFTALYAAYQTRRSVYTSFYGSLANLALSMVWVYTCVNFFLLGAVFNVHYADRIAAFFRRKTDRKKG